MTDEITKEVLRFVLEVLANGHLSRLTDPNDRLLRIAMWNQQIDVSLLADVFAVLKPGVDVEGALKLEDWNWYFHAALVRLADEILLLQVAQGDNSEPFSLHIFLDFDIIAGGRGVCRQVNSLPNYL
jgi:hypothetical protein